MTNFALLDRPAATLLIDSLQIVSPTEIHLGIKDQIERLEPQLRGGTALLVPILSIKDIERAEEEHTDLRHSRSMGTELEHTAWETYRPGMPIPSTPGSEAAIGNLIRDLTGDTPGKEPSQWLHPRTDLDTLRDNHCRVLVLVTDYSGSGKQAVRFARTFARNRRVRSWRSFGWLKVIVVAYAVSLKARDVITGSPFIDALTVAVPAASFDDAEWTQSERQTIEQLCWQYAPGSRPQNPLGFDDSGGLFLSHTAVPNNLPKILRRQPPGWSPLLDGRDGRIFPQDLLVELRDYQPPDRDLAAIAQSANQRRLARAIKSGRLRTPADRLVATLALVGHKTVDVATISHRLARPGSEIEAMLDFLVQVGFITDDLSITPSGRAELQHAKRLDRIGTANLSGSDAPYYPRALR